MFDVIHTIDAVTYAIQIDSNNHFKELGLDGDLFICIIHVCEKPGMSLGKLVGNTQADRTTAFKTIEKLATFGYFELEKGVVDQEIKHVYPTEKVMNIYPQLRGYEQKQSDFLLSSLSAEEVTQLE